MRIVALITLALPLALGCSLGKSMDIPLISIGNSGVSGTVHLKNTICKSPCVTTQFSLSGAGSSPRGVVRLGSCAAPGEMLGSTLSTDPTFLEPISYVGSLADLTGKACIQVIDDADPSAPRILACGDIP